MKDAKAHRTIYSPRTACYYLIFRSSYVLSYFAMKNNMKIANNLQINSISSYLCVSSFEWTFPKLTHMKKPTP